jgi:cobalt-zinc-cadmium efflux system outer membrane protein
MRYPMRTTIALLALALASSLGATSLADEPKSTLPAQPGTARPAPRGLLGRLRKPRESEVPSIPKSSVAAPSAASGEKSPPIPIESRSATFLDPPIRRTQATPADMGMPIGPGTDSTNAAGVQSLSLQQALTGALTSNPDLVALRLGNPAQASAEAVEVARRFPTTLNPTVFIDYRPITLIPRDPFGTGSSTGGTGAGGNRGGFYHSGQGYLLVAIRQPFELGRQTMHRHGVAQAAYRQVQWQIVQAELTVLVQTSRFFQTAAYRREKLRVAEQLADFNENLLKTLERRLGANQALPADVSLARVESRATRQLARAARQDYLTALTDLRNQIGIPEAAAETVPLGEFTLPGDILPLDEQAMVRAALACRPDIHAAQAAIEGAGSAVRLAKADMIPTTIFGPQYVQNEAGVQYVGFNLAFNLPVVNSGRPLVIQREAERRRALVAYQQVQQRAVAQVRSAVAKWNGATALVGASSGLTGELAGDVASLERLFEAGQTDLARVQQARQRLIQLENAQLDALWAATQAQADLMLALGVPSMIQSLLQATEGAAGRPATPPTSAPGSPPAFAPTPPAPTTNPTPFTPVPSPSPAVR